MPNIASAAKRMRQEEKRYAHNRAVRSRMRTFIRQAREAVARGDRAEAEEAVRRAVSEIDRAAKKGTIHANKADRQKSRLMKSLNEVA